MVTMGIVPLKVHYYYYYYYYRAPTLWQFSSSDLCIALDTLGVTSVPMMHLLISEVDELYHRQQDDALRSWIQRCLSSITSLKLRSKGKGMHFKRKQNKKILKKI